MSYHECGLKINKNTPFSYHFEGRTGVSEYYQYLYFWNYGSYQTSCQVLFAIYCVQKGPIIITSVFDLFCLGFTLGIVQGSLLAMLSELYVVLRIEPTSDIYKTSTLPTVPSLWPHASAGFFKIAIWLLRECFIILAIGVVPRLPALPSFSGGWNRLKCSVQVLFGEEQPVRKCRPTTSS